MRSNDEALRELPGFACCYVPGAGIDKEEDSVRE